MARFKSLFLRQYRRYPNTDGAYRGTMLALEFLVLTAARSGEVRNARWEQIDVMLPFSGDGWRFQRLRVRFQSRLSGLSQMSFLGSARFIWVLSSF